MYTPEMKIAADSGNTDAQIYIGNYYEHGLGVVKNEKEAFRYYKMAADNGALIGKYNLALCYAYGRGTKKNIEEAFRYYKMAADNGDVNAQYRLAICYELGAGVPKNQGTTHNEQEAVKYFQLAANQDHAFAQHILSLRYQIGRGVPQNTEKAVFYHRMATMVSKDLLPQPFISNVEKILVDCPSFLLKIIDKKSTKSLAEHVLSSDINKSHIILHPPHAINQRGPTCGLSTLRMGLFFGNPGRFIPPTRKNLIKPSIEEKNKNKEITSLRQVAKKYGSVIGGVFDISCLEKTAKEFGFHGCKIIRGKKNYIENILKSIQMGHCVILPVDHKDGFPCEGEGKKLHYALAWGFLFKKNSYYFLVTQWGKHYLWNAEALRSSHKYMPEENVHDAGVYYKDHTHDDYFPKEEEQKIPDSDVRKIPLTSLEKDFKFTALAVPSGNKNFLVVRNCNEKKSMYSAIRLSNTHLGLRFLFNVNDTKEKEEDAVQTLSIPGLR